MSLQLSSSVVEILHQGSSLLVEDPNDVMLSPNAIFCVGFYSVGQNAYSFAVWYSQANGETQDATGMDGEP